MIVDSFTVIGQVGQESGDADTLQRFAEAAGTDFCLVCHADRRDEKTSLDEVDANLAALKACESRGRLVPLYWVRAGQFDSNPHAVAGALVREAFVGTVFRPDLHGYELTDADRLNPYCNVLTRVGLPVIVGIPPGMPVDVDAIIAFARQWSKLPVVISGALSGLVRGEQLEILRGRGGEQTGLFLDTARATPQEAATAASTLGTDRVLYASGTVQAGDDAAEQVRHWRQEFAGLVSDDVSGAILGGNAKRLFGLSGRRA